MKRVLSTFLILTSLFAMGQTDITPETKPFYSTYIRGKISKRWSADVHALKAYKSFEHEPWLMQYNLGVSYRLDRVHTITASFGNSLYEYGNEKWWTRHYPRMIPNDQGMASFKILGMQFKRNDEIGHYLRISNRVIAQYFFPRLEKYETRIQYNVKLSYRRKNLPLRFRPFVQAAIYYYHRGKPLSYYSANLDYVYKFASPNGFHRYRFKYGASIQPFKKPRISLTAYYCYNREFNTSFGNDINVSRPSRRTDKVFTDYRFNDYNIFGLQLAYFF